MPEDRGRTIRKDRALESAALNQINSVNRVNKVNETGRGIAGRGIAR